MDMGRSDIMADRRLRLANSSPDVKALFNSPAYIYNLETQEDVDSSYMNTPVQGVDYWTPLAPIVRLLLSQPCHRLTSECRGRDCLIVQDMRKTQSSVVLTRYWKPN